MAMPDGRAADPLHAARRRPRRRAAALAAAAARRRRCMRAIPTTCSAAAASCAATSTPRSPTCPLGVAPARRFETAPRRACLHRARGRLRRDRRGAGQPARRARVRIFACTQTPYMDRDEIAQRAGDRAGAGAHRALGDRRRLRRQARPLGAAAARGRRLEARPRRCAWSTSGRSRCSRSTKRHPAQMTRERGLRRRRHARRLRFQRRLQHRRLFVVGADGRQPGADPRERPVPRAARARADPRRADATTASPARSAASACRSRRCSASC